MDLTVFPLYADGSTGDAAVETALPERTDDQAHEVGVLIIDAAIRVQRNARHAMDRMPVGLDITLTFDPDDS